MAYTTGSSRKSANAKPTSGSKTEDLVLNPSIELVMTCDFRLKGKNPVTINLKGADSTLAVTQLLRDLVMSEDPKALLKSLSKQNLLVLKELGILVPGDEAPANVSYGPDLTEKSLELAPSRLPSLPASVDSLLVNPSLLVQMGVERPADPDNRLPEEGAFPIHGPLFWIKDPGTEMAWFYSADAESREIVARLRSGSLRPSSLDRRRLELLYWAEILVLPDHASSRKELWSRNFAASRESLRTEQFAVLRSIVPPLQISALRAYYRAMEAEGYLEIDRQQVIQMRFKMHNETTASFIHRQTGKLMQCATGEPIFPSYTYVSAYLPGATLNRHVDRPQCKWNGSLLMDMNPETSVEESWPIYVEVQGRTRSIQLGMGDAVIYRGSEIPHWRDAIQPGHRQTLLLLHYVPLDFTSEIT